MASSTSWTSAASSWAGVDATLTNTSSSPHYYALNEDRGNPVTWSGITRKRGTLQDAPPCAGGYWSSGQMDVVINWSLVNSLGYTASQKSMVAAHEMGHAFGLAHNGATLSGGCPLLSCTRTTTLAARTASTRRGRTTREASMRSTRRAAIAATVTVLLGGCAGGGNDAPDIPVIHIDGTRPVEYTSLKQLAGNASAIIVAKPTGEQFNQPLPAEQGGVPTSAPTIYVKLEVNRVLSGSLDATTIDLVSPGTDERTGEPALLNGGAVILFVTPAMYAADTPAGGYVVVGGPAGVFAQSGKSFLRVDSESPKMPTSVTPDDTSWPQITMSEQAFLHRGPR